VFALTAADAAAVLDAAGGLDPADPFSRGGEQRSGRGFAGLTVGILRQDQREFFGDSAARSLYDAALEQAAALGSRLLEVDLVPFLMAAELLYSGPWVAERTAAVGEFLDARPDAFWPTTRTVIETGRRFSAVDAFMGQYRLAELARAAAAVWHRVDVLLLPTTPTIYRVDEIAAEPILLNSRLGTYTNFVNLLDLCALALPTGFRPDGLPLGVTLMAPAWSDRLLAGLGQAWQRATGLPLGATGAALPAERDLPVSDPEEVELAVVGAHLTGGPLNHELVSRTGRLVRTARTAACYSLYALAGIQPAKPGLVRDPRSAGGGIEVEVWALPIRALGELVARVPPPLAIGSVELADGSHVKGFLCEGHDLAGANDITAHGGWRAYLGAAAGGG
jgi:allophanate hydrolase